MFASSSQLSVKLGSIVGHNNHSLDSYSSPQKSLSRKSDQNSGQHSPPNRMDTNVKPIATNNINPTTNSVTNTKNVSERVIKANVKITDNLYDIESWNVLIKDAQGKRIEESREFFEKLVIQFPNSGRFWKLYIETEMKSRNYDKVERLFQRCLTKVLNIDLWRCYLTYIKDTKNSFPDYREKMAKAYDFTLEKIGIDIQSYSVWNDYVHFLKNVEAVGSYAENQKITAVRRVYQRGVVNPMISIESFWKDYITYEQNINQMIAEKMIADRSKDYMNARRVAKEFEAVTRGLNRNAPAIPPQNTSDEAKQVELWRKYIQWEKSNPMKTEDTSLVIKRVQFAYEQCILCLGHHPDVWYEFASYIEEKSKEMGEKGNMNEQKTLQEEVSAIYDRATTTLLSTNILINFAYADFEESRNRKEEAIKIYEKLLNIQTPGFDPTLVYIQYMKFRRRTESITTARSVFKRAREDSRCGHEIWSAAALMEYYCNKDSNVTSKIFELGLKKFGNSPEFILSYIDYLTHLNEENNIRVLFERVLTTGTLAPEKSLEIWTKFLEFECQIGDLSSVIKVEKRRALAIEKLNKQTSETAWLVDRYKFQNLLPCSQTELKSIGYVVKQNQQNPFTPVVANVVSNNVPSTLTTYPKPDFSQMVPYKPKQNPIGNLHRGGIFPPPQAVTTLLAQLPHPSSFNGPFVSIDDLMNLIRTKFSTLDTSPRPEGIPVQDGRKLFTIAMEAAENNTNISKRTLNDEDDEADGDDSNPAPPQYDIYRSRQLQKKPRN
ncbi:cleavage stimulation factor subunit 3-like [Oppia nitens]|uniref:cleavage stimulation factor subunit 3-like n=1 Tax=Oppia nitens TaxID=1686743 RepID=UPI0023DAD398|nr:cleavage stimulation factor subunit 3-like [Oppia nitens]